MYSDKTMWLRVEEVARKHSDFEASVLSEVNQTCKFVRILCSDKEFDSRNIYVIAPNCLYRKKIAYRHGHAIEFFVKKSDILLELHGSFENYVPLTHVNSNKLCDEHRGIPRLEYV